jgi:hypothetical protein
MTSIDIDCLLRFGSDGIALPAATFTKTKMQNYAIEYSATDSFV